jgi:hypothetical protein
MLPIIKYGNNREIEWGLWGGCRQDGMANHIRHHESRQLSSTTILVRKLKEIKGY